MINPKELRIGNKVLDASGNIVEIDSIDNRGINLCAYFSSDGIEYDHLLNSINYIPLTEEWLVKFGFKGEYNLSAGWNDIPSRYYTDRMLPMNLFVVYFDNAWHFILRDTIQGLGTIQYVHQLQNLYFALTGEELTLK